MTDDILARVDEALEGITGGPWEHRVGPADETPAEYVQGTLIGGGEPCGTPAAYARHVRSNEPPCRLCRQANARRDADRKASR